MKIRSQREINCNYPKNHKNTKQPKKHRKKIMKELKKASQIHFNSDKEGVWFFIILFIDGNETLVSEFDAINIESKISL